MLLKDTLLIVGTLVFVALAVVLARLRRSRHLIIETGEAVEIPGDGCGANPSEEADMSGLLLSTLRRDLSLAAEHVHSIRWLLEIAMQHQQPIPRAALTNLDLVSKHLGELQRQIQISGQERVTESEVSAAAHRQEIRHPLHPRRPSFESRASPSDRSVLCD
jgi:hypothetical protein